MYCSTELFGLSQQLISLRFGNNMVDTMVGFHHLK